MLDMDRSLARRLLEPAATAVEHGVIQHLPYVSAVQDDVVMLRDGDLMAAFLVDGIPAETAAEDDVDALSLAMSHAIAQVRPDIGIYVHRFSTATTPALRPVDHTISPFAAAVDHRWQSHIQTMGLRARQIMVSVTIRPSKVGSLWSRITSDSGAAQRSAREKRLIRLNETLDTVMEALRAAAPERLKLSDGTWIGLLRTLLTGQYYTSPLGGDFRPLADRIATSRIDFAGDSFTVFGTDAQDTRFGAIFSLKDYPSLTVPGLFARFDLPYDTVITHSFTPADVVTALDRIARTLRQMSVADDAAASLRDQLTEAADDVASGRVGMGYHHATITVFAPSGDALDAAAAAIRTAAQRARAVVVREDIGARAAYFAQHPGNYSYRARAGMISSDNFAHMAALHATSPGLPRSQTPWGEAITLLPDVRGEPFRFNFHLGGDPGARTVGHTLVIGTTGSGKTLGAMFLLAQALRVSPRIIAFDKDRGMEMPIRAMGGAYATVHMGEPTGFNPFAAEIDDRGTAWLTQWLDATLSPQGPLSALQRDALAKAAQANAATDPTLRTMEQFRTQLRAVDDGGDLHTRLGLWDDGQFGWLFSGQSQDATLTFERDVTAFDLTEIFETQEVRTAWLAYVFRRIERLIDDERPTIILIDEAWKVLDDRFFEAMLKDWALTLRKKNVVLILMTQRVAHLRQSAAGGSILESCVTTILFPNARFTHEEIADLNFTDAEAAIATSSSAGSRFALIRSGDSSTVVDMDLTALGPLLNVLGGGKGQGGPADWRARPEFWKDVAE